MAEKERESRKQSFKQAKRTIPTREIVPMKKRIGESFQIQRDQLKKEQNNKNGVKQQTLINDPNLIGSVQQNQEAEAFSPCTSLQNIALVEEKVKPFKINKFLVSKHRKRSMTSSQFEALPAAQEMNTTVSNFNNTKYDSDRSDFFLASSNFLSSSSSPNLLKNQQYQQLLSKTQLTNIKEKTLPFASSTDITSSAYFSQKSQQQKQNSKLEQKDGQFKNMISSIAHNIPPLKDSWHKDSLSSLSQRQYNFQNYPQHTPNKAISTPTKPIFTSNKFNGKLEKNIEFISGYLTNRIKEDFPQQSLKEITSSNNIQIIENFTREDQGQMPTPKNNLQIDSSQQIYHNKYIELKIPFSQRQIEEDKQNDKISSKNQEFMKSQSFLNIASPYMTSPHHAPSILKSSTSPKHRNYFQASIQPPNTSRQNSNPKKKDLESCSPTSKFFPGTPKKNIQSVAQMNGTGFSDNQSDFQYLQKPKSFQSSQNSHQNIATSFSTNFLAVTFKNNLIERTKKSGNSVFSKMSLESRVQLERLDQYINLMHKEYDNVKKVGQLIHQIVYHIPYLTHLLFQDDQMILREKIDQQYIRSFLLNKEKMEIYLNPQELKLQSFESWIEAKILSDIVFLNEKLSELIQKRFKDKFNQLSSQIVDEHYNVKLMEKNLQKRICDNDHKQFSPQNKVLEEKHNYKGIDYYTFQAKGTNQLTFSQNYKRMTKRLGDFAAIDKQSVLLSSNLDFIVDKINSDSRQRMEINYNKHQPPSMKTYFKLDD